MPVTVWITITWVKVRNCKKKTKKKLCMMAS